ncbi:hypothetical protein BJY04DRAFT_213730 [Aspergillus karnatakaensis]|uniref:uncharacterized protein n=1 Tax=Aspergillus karnatakaensis TaxID=1810916 RepID=UPI003CCCA3F2
MQQPSIAEVLTSFNTGNVRIRRFWLLVLSVFAATFAWLSAFCYAARLLPMPVWLDQNSQTGSYPITPLHGQNISLLSYVDIFLAFLSGSTLDAVVVVANFNRPLTQQFHYFVSLRMAVLGVLLSISLRIGVIGYRRDPHYLVAVICAIGAIYMAFIVATDKLHTFFPKRYISTRTGSLFHHIQHLGALDMPWSHALVLLALNVVVCFSLAVALPPHWAPLGPPVQIVLEPVFLWIMGADKTARYNIIVAPVVVAYSCLDWGLRQVVMSPRLAISPGAFLMLILAHRLILDLQLCTSLAAFQPLIILALIQDCTKNHTGGGFNLVGASIAYAYMYGLTYIGTFLAGV